MAGVQWKGRKLTGNKYSYEYLRYISRRALPILGWSISRVFIVHFILFVVCKTELFNSHNIFEFFSYHRFLNTSFPLVFYLFFYLHSPHETIQFDLMAHEPFLLKLANGYTLLFGKYLYSYGKYLGITLIALLVVKCWRCCRVVKKHKKTE